MRVRAFALFGSSLVACAATLGVIAAERAEPRSVVEAEYAFASAAKPLGVRGAFLKFLANDSIVCTPQPVNGIESTAEGPATADTLLWYPTHSQTADSGDLGYTTGPWTFRSADGKTEDFGTFLSVWRKQPDGAWRVVVDCGINHPKFAVAPVGLKVAASASPSAMTASAADRSDASAAKAIASSGNGSPSSAVSASPAPGSWKDPVAAAEARFTASAARGAAAAFQEFAAPDARVLIRGSIPTVGAEPGAALLSAQKLGATWQHVFASESRDGMLGYAWGYIGEAQADKPGAVYINIWRRSKPGAPWQIVAQSLQMLPQKS